MFTGFIQHKCYTLQEAQRTQQEIKKKTYVQPEIFKVQDPPNSFFLVIEQPAKFLVEEDITRMIA